METYEDRGAVTLDEEGGGWVAVMGAGFGNRSWVGP